MIKVSNTTRSKLLIDSLNEADTNYAYLDDPDNRWIIDGGPARQGLGYLVVYNTDRCNVATESGHALYGYQDNVRTIINRSQSHKTTYEDPYDLSPLVCS